jgi:hypothetical protein
LRRQNQRAMKYFDLGEGRHSLYFWPAVTHAKTLEGVRKRMRGTIARQAWR